MYGILPNEILKIVYEYDSSFRIIFNLCIKEMNSFFYFNRTIDMLNFLNSNYQIYNKVNKSHFIRLSFLEYVKHLNIDVRTAYIYRNIEKVKEIWYHYRLKDKKINKKIYSKFPYPYKK